MKNIHVIKTDKASRLHKYDFDGFALSKEALNWKEAKNIYITSDEEIKVGDWFAVELFKITGESRGLHIEKCIKLNDIWCNDFDVVSTRHKGNCNKTILTTDQDLIKDGIQEIPNEFLEWFVKNPSCEKVKVVKGFADGTSYGYNFLDYKIIIPKEEHKQEDCSCTDKCLGYLTKTCERIEEPKQETLEEAAAKYARGWGEYDDNKAFIKGAKWQQERMYNEEEVLNFTQTIIQQYKLGNTNIEQLDLLKETLQQFKNK